MRIGKGEAAKETRNFSQMGANLLLSSYHFLDETFVVVYWIGIWHLLTISGVLELVWFNWLCLVLGAFGLLAIKAIEPLDVQQRLLPSRATSTNADRRVVRVRAPPQQHAVASVARAMRA